MGNHSFFSVLTYLLVVFIGFHSNAAIPTNVKDIEYTISYFEDQDGVHDIEDVSKLPFSLLETDHLNFGLTESVYWFKIEVTNHTRDSLFWFSVQNPSITNIHFYSDVKGKVGIQHITINTPVKDRPLSSHYPIFQMNQAPGVTSTYFARVQSKNVMELPMSIQKGMDIIDQINSDQLFFGIYAGIILVMFFYNFFLYLTVKDNPYLFYVMYILVVGMTQASLKGFATTFIWGENEWLTENAPHIITAGSGIFSILFAFSFLHLRYYAHVVHKILCINLVVYFFSIVIYISGHFIIGQQLLQVNTTAASIFVLFSAVSIYFKGYKPALFFWIAWSFFLGGVIIYILKEVGILPYNNFTSNAILIGSGLEAALLSFALADKINSYKKEKEESQLRAIMVAKENEKLVREQNTVLEQRVEERTHALKESNESLQKTLTHLKETQAQLVEAEKMASLGQLTAGVAHEINNPINFVTSNVAPLKRDVKIVWDALAELEAIALSDSPMAEKVRLIHAYKEEMDIEYLKTEIDFLLKGMHEGANRTAEIVKSLRIFSRVDEDSLKFADINEGLDSTLVILNSVVKEAVQVEKQYAQLPLIECYPGKLNQVFLNIITNALYAINKKFDGKPGGVLQIATKADEINVYISIKDNGIGMDDEVREKIFEPFFTTKEVGEGTGLGMSIAYNTIKKHHGSIKIESKVGEGTTFILIIPIKQETE